MKKIVFSFLFLILVVNSIGVYWYIDHTKEVNEREEQYHKEQEEEVKDNKEDQENENSTHETYENEYENEPEYTREELEAMTVEERKELIEEEGSIAGVSDDGKFYNSNVSKKEQMEFNKKSDKEQRYERIKIMSDEERKNLSEEEKREFGILKDGQLE